MSTWRELKDNPRLKKIYEDRIKIMKIIREFFWSLGFAEADTPVAVRYAGQEPYLNPVALSFENPRGEKHDFYLQTSPEYALKKLLCAGWNRIFEICKCFRNGEEFGGIHNPEFTMIEWYRSPGNYRDIMDDVENLFKFAGEKLGVEYARIKNREVPVMLNWERMSMKSAWRKFAGVNLDGYLSLEKMKELAVSKGFGPGVRDRYEDVFYKIFLNEIEPKLGWDKPVFIYDYPLQMSSLSRTCEDIRYAERFECYIGGMEICNAFGELTDARQQQSRLEDDKDLRAKLGKETWPVDEDFIGALRSGMAEAGGIALGVDRMVLLFTGARDLNEVIFESVKNQIDN